MPKSTPRPTNSTAKATEIRFKAPTIHRPIAAVKVSPTARLTRTASTIRACLSASHSSRRTTRIVTTPFRAAPSATVANSSSASGDRSGEAHPDAIVRRQAQFLDRRADGLGRLAARLQIAVVEDRLDVDEPAKLGGLRRVAGDQPAPGEGRMLALLRRPRGRRRSRSPPASCLRASSFPTRTPSIDCEIAPRTPCSVGSAASVPRKGSALINCAISLRTSSTDLKRMPLRAKNSPPSGRVTVRIRSDCGASASASAAAASSAASGVVASTTAMIRSVRCGKSVVEPHLLLAPGERARQELAAVGVDRDVAREIDAGENGHDEEARNDEPGMTGRKAHGPRNRGDDQGAVVSVHGSRVEAMVRAVLSIGNGEAGLFGPAAIEANMGSRAPGSSFAANGLLPDIARSSSAAHYGRPSDFRNKYFCKTELRAMLLRWLIPPTFCGRRRRALSCP